MRKVLVARAGGYRELQLVECADVSSAAGGVVLDVEAIGVNYADCVVRMGLYASAREYVGWPITPGFEVVGTPRTGATGAVATVAPRLATELGGPLIGLTRFGGYATQVWVAQDLLFALPPGYSAAEAAGFSVTALTAWFALRKLAGLQPGMRILVHSAAGGVGMRLCQIAQILGADVVGIVGAPHKVASVEALGARVICKAQTDWAASARKLSPRGYDSVLDATGAETLRSSYDLVASMGRLVIYGFHSMLPRASRGSAEARGAGRPSWLKLGYTFFKTPRFSPLKLTGDNKSVMGFNLSYLFEERALAQQAMAELTDWARRGLLPPLPTRVFAFDRVADAHAALESGTTQGKLTLRVDGAFTSDAAGAMSAQR